MMSGLTYRDAGVDIDAGNRAVALMKAAVEATHGPEVLAGIGSFGGLFDATSLKGMTSPTLVASADGVGTKTRVAAQYGRYDTVGHDIVNHCIDDILVQGARPLFFLDYVASAKLVPEMIADIVSGCAAACSAAGCALLGGETAEMPGVYAEGEFDLVGTIIGVVDRDKIIDGRHIQPGDQVIGLASAGLHTNGFSLARRVFAGWDFAAHVDELGMPLGDALLAPHRCYLPEFDAVTGAGVDILGLAHITGGGLIENPPRILPAGTGMVIDRSAWTMPPLFQLIQRLGGVSDREMARAFNCGLGMLVVVRADAADATMNALNASNLASAVRMGEIVRREDTGDEPVRLD
jgi:phosphoribosylformylglycinamidine cyclo-ligase